MRASNQLRDHRLKTELDWQRFVNEKHVSVESSWLQQSWGASASRIALAQTCAPMDNPDTVRQLFIESPLYLTAKPLLDELILAVKDSGYVIGLSDSSATLQWTAASRVMAKRAEKAHFLPSAHWDEASIGTNAVGLAARLIKPCSLFSAQHYIPSLHEWVCYAAPIVSTSGNTLGVLDISAPWQNSNPMALATVSHYAQQIAIRWAQIPNAALFDLNVCGQQAGQFLGKAPLPRRLQEIFIALALHPEGLHLESLHAHVYGDEPVSLSTLKSEMSHIRQHIGDMLQARPYRLQPCPNRCATDAQLIEKLLLQGDFKTALTLYQQPLLPQSQAPAVVQYRDYLHQLFIRCLVASEDTQSLWQFFVMHEAEYAVLLRLQHLLPENDLRHAAIQAKLLQLDA